MEPTADQQPSNKLLFLQSNFDTRITNAFSADEAADDSYDGSNHLGRMNPSSEDSKTIMGWEGRARAGIVRPIVASSSCLADDRLPTDFDQSDLRFPPHIEARRQFSIHTTLPDDLRSMNSSRSSDNDVPPFAVSSTPTGVSSKNRNVRSSRCEKRDDGTIRVPSGSGYRIMTPFPWRLHEILEEVEEKKLDHIVSWLPNGLAFQVHCQQSFSDVIIPMFFRHSRYKSFQRQLYLYGFRSMETHSLVRGAYFHPQFRRDDRTLCRHIVRIKGDAQSDGSEGSKNIQCTKSKSKTVGAESSSSGNPPATAPQQLERSNVYNQTMTNISGISQTDSGQNSGRHEVDFSGKLLMFSDDIIDLFKGEKRTD